MAFVVGEIAAPITADPSQFNRAMADVKAKGEELSRNIGAQWGSLSKKMEDVGKSLTKYVTAPIVGAGVLSAKSAIDFESAFAGVRKTVEATEAQFAALEEGIRGMSREIPAAATEIAGVAEAAGQLGIETDSILGFTRTMIDLGEATNLSATDAATALARLANITQMPQSEFDRLGSTIVALGNNLATTEAEIVEMGLRLAGAGKQVGMSEAEILSLAGALSSVGIEADAGGSAFSRVMSQMQLATETGGRALNDFASVAGMSADEFRQAFQEDATSAIISFVEGLGNAEDRGTSAIKVLDDMGITEIRVRDALLRAAGAGDLFAESIEIGATAWEENTALTKEAEQRYKTLASQLKIAKNNVIDSAISIGEILSPHIQRASELLRELTERFRALSPEQRENYIKWGLIVATIGPVLTVGAKAIGVIKGIGAALMWLNANPIGLVIIGIAALVAAGVTLYKNWDTVTHYGKQAWGSLKVFVLKAIAAIGSAYEKLYGWVPVLGNKIRDAHAAIRKSIEEEQIILSERSKDWEKSVALKLSMKSPGKDMWQIKDEIKEATSVNRELENSLKDTFLEFQNLGDGASSAGDSISSAAEEIRTVWEGTTEAIKTALSTLRTQHETEMTYTEMSGNNVEILRLKHQQLNKELEVQKTVVASTREEIEKATAAGVLEGETTKDLAQRIDELNQQLAEEELAQARLEKQIYDTSESIKTQGKDAKDLVAELNEVVNAYHIGLAQALEEYQAKVKQTNEILRRDTEALQQELSSRLDDIASRGAERERQVTAQFQREIENRTRSLMNFVGIFDEVTGREVSGETLLRNLEGQVSAFSDWQKNIQALAARGVDEGLLQELREMGPKAAPELAALNTLTDEQLSKYVELWKQRQKQAREEAVGQLSQQRDEMNRQLEEIRADTANQMEQQRQEIAQKLAEMQAQAKQELEKYKLEWEKKNEEIRKNTEKNIQDIHDKFSKLVGKSTDYGIELVDNFTSGMESRFENLRRTLENMASIVDSYMPHSPAKVGPLRRLNEYGPALVKGVVDGVAGAIPKLRSMAYDFAGSLVPASLGGIGSNTGSHHSNNVVINVYTWDEAERALARLGVR
jgi:TP901 family phage tail tape measure protein